MPGHAHRGSGTSVSPLCYTIIEKITPNSPTVLEIFKFDISSNLIGRKQLSHNQKNIFFPDMRFLQDIRPYAKSFIVGQKK